MSSNIIIKIIEIVLLGGILLHVIYALVLQVQNWIARPKRYNKANYSNTSFFSKFMIHTAAIILVFLAIHFVDFYFKAKFGHGAEILVDGVMYHDFASEIVDKFKMLPFVIFYIAAFVFLGFHLIHGFQSAFKTLGLDNKKYNPAIQVLAIIYSVLVVAGFSIIPLVIYYM
jgi:succinate dehydrogenase / fumarate reductase cytochrome b subunit